MAQRTDLYSILVSYANKNNSPYIKIDSFLDFLERYAKTASEENPEWLKWAQDKAVKFWAEMSVLVEEGKCELLADTDNDRIYMSHYYPQLIQKSYQNVDEDAEIPFHNEESLRITVPETQIRPLSTDYDLLVYLGEPQDSDIPILRIIFPDGFGSALVLASMVPRRLAEMAILKIRSYLRKGGNNEYVLRKLSPQLQGRESNLKDQFNRILVRPLDCFNSIEEGAEFSCLFWAHFCVILKNDIKKKKERLSDDIAAIQSAYIIETISGYYKSEAMKRREAELAFKELENHLAKPPYLYTLDQIRKFTSPKGILLLSLYEKEDLDEWIRKKTTESEKNKLPPLLITKGDADERCFALKDKMPALCVRHLTIARIQVKDALTKHWRKLFLDYRSEPAMENNEEFEKTLYAFTKKLCPLLITLLEDLKLPLVYDELDQCDGGIAPSARIFSNGHLLPYSSLLLIRRKELLSDIKLMLPFWYSMPILTAIIAFFKNLGRKKKIRKASSVSIENAGEDILGEKDRSGEIRGAAQELELILVPPGYTIEVYLEELEDRWSRLIDKQARDNLIEDVKSLIRDDLRRILKIQKHFKLTQDSIHQAAQNIVTRTPALASLSGRDSLILYTELYLLRLLEGIK